MWWGRTVLCWGRPWESPQILCELLWATPECIQSHLYGTKREWWVWWISTDCCFTSKAKQMRVSIFTGNRHCTCRSLPYSPSHPYEHSNHDVTAQTFLLWGTCASHHVYTSFHTDPWAAWELKIIIFLFSHQLSFLLPPPQWCHLWRQTWQLLLSRARRARELQYRNKQQTESLSLMSVSWCLCENPHVWQLSHWARWFRRQIKSGRWNNATYLEIWCDI